MSGDGRLRPILAPKVPGPTAELGWGISPGHRHGTPATTPSLALKGRDNRARGLHRCGPFRAASRRALPFPGRCPGLVCFAPSGQGRHAPDPGSHRHFPLCVESFNHGLHGWTRMGKRQSNHPFLIRVLSVIRGQTSCLLDPWWGFLRGWSPPGRAGCEVVRSDRGRSVVGYITVK
jgi:hypothetical protein